MHGMGELQILQNITAFANELTTSTLGGTVYIPAHCQLEAVILIPSTTLDNAVTNVSGFVVAKAAGAAYATETTIATLNPWENATTAFAQGNGTIPGRGTAATFDGSISTGFVVVKNLTPPAQLRAGDKLYVRGSTTAASATGTWMASYLVRVAGLDASPTTVFSPFNTSAAVDS